MAIHVPIYMLSAREVQVARGGSHNDGGGLYLLVGEKRELGVSIHGAERRAPITGARLGRAMDETLMTPARASGPINAVTC
jgi:hypothetical protein